ncbi:MBL fold metallo-hydrolase, partial [Kitasatospora aureofaciens]|uniref:MBL fold metallo-hydrolase n=1 Tax=Kitasatospora aureofaciens TaxID=1894 RepID=UPI0037C668DF
LRGAGTAGGSPYAWIVTNPDIRDSTKISAAHFDVYSLPSSHQVGPFRLDATLLPHHVPHAGVRLTAPGLTLAYSGDAGTDPALARLAAGADLFIAGATLQGPSADDGDHHLMNAVEAGAWATRSGARRLLLTHFWPGSDRTRSTADARSRFSGEVIAAEEGMVLSF